MANVDELISAVEGMTVLELNDLVKKLEEKFGVSAAAPVMMGAVAGGSAAGAAEVKEEFDVVLTSSGDKKIQVLKVLRELTWGSRKLRIWLTMRRKLSRKRSRKKKLPKSRKN